MTDLPECSCPPTADIARMSLEGHDFLACSVHRPERGKGFASATALNSDQLIAGLGEPLNF